MNKIKTTAISLALGLIAVQACAAVATSDLQTTASLTATCFLKTTEISFGSINFISETNARGNINVRCSSSTVFDLKVSEGNSGTQLQRTLLGQSKNDLLKYNIYTTTDYNTIVGDGTNGTSHPMNGKSNGRDFFNALPSGRSAYIAGAYGIEFYLYGQVPANQYVAPDNYLDTLTVTVTY